MSMNPPLPVGGLTPTEIINQPATSEANAPESQNFNQTAFFNNSAQGAGAFSAVVSNTGGTFGKGRITVKSALANTFTVQVSVDNVNWYDLTQDNAGTLFTIATVAGHLATARDLPGPVPPFMRLVVVTADTVTAGYEFFGL